MCSQTRDIRTTMAPGAAPAALRVIAALGCIATAAAHTFRLAPRPVNDSVPPEPAHVPGSRLGCGGTIYWPGTIFENGVWSYQDYDCSDYWAYDFIVNVTAQPNNFRWNQVSSLFQLSNATIANTGSCAGFDYTVTVTNPMLNDHGTICSGTLEPGDPAVTCTIMTVPGQYSYLDYYFIDFNIHNRNWVCGAEGNVQIVQACQAGGPAGADLCSNGNFYGFIDAAAPQPILNYVTGGCVSSMRSKNAFRLMRLPRARWRTYESA